MKEFENPLAKLKHREVPYTRMKEEERSYLIFNLYRLGILKSQDVKDFNRLSLLNTSSFWLFPLFTLSYSSAVAKFMTRDFRYVTKSHQCMLTFSVAAFSWYVFSQINPFKVMYRKEKKKVLDYLDVNMAVSVFAFNAMLPRKWTENFVNLKTSRLYYGRKFFGNGIFMAPEGIQDTYFDEEDTSFDETY